jgi:hypothetical protein
MKYTPGGALRVSLIVMVVESGGMRGFWPKTAVVPVGLPMALRVTVSV